MDYKTLYSLIFAPIIFTILYMVYLQFQTPEVPEEIQQNTFNNIQMSQENFEQISLEEFKTELLDNNTILIDVRTLEEQATYGTISDEQEHIIYGSPAFEGQIANLDASKKYLVYCWHGVRSTAVREYMREKGFSWVKDLEGGIDNWNKG